MLREEEFSKYQKENFRSTVYFLKYKFSSIHLVFIFNIIYCIKYKALKINRFLVKTFYY